jgi:hypothetical protein
LVDVDQTALKIQVLNSKPQNLPGA